MCHTIGSIFISEGIPSVEGTCSNGDNEEKKYEGSQRSELEKKNAPVHPYDPNNHSELFTLRGEKRKKKEIEKIRKSLPRKTEK